MTPAPWPRHLRWNRPAFMDTLTVQPEVFPMTRHHPAFPPEFRRRMVHVVRPGRAPGELAGEFEPSLLADRRGTRPPFGADRRPIDPLKLGGHSVGGCSGVRLQDAGRRDDREDPPRVFRPGKSIKAICGRSGKRCVRCSARKRRSSPTSGGRSRSHASWTSAVVLIVSSPKNPRRASAARARRRAYTACWRCASMPSGVSGGRVNKSTIE